MDSFIGNFTAGYSVIPEAVFPGSDMATIVPYATGLVGGKKKSKSKKSKSKKSKKGKRSKMKKNKSKMKKNKRSKMKKNKKRSNRKSNKKGGSALHIGIGTGVGLAAVAGAAYLYNKNKSKDDEEDDMPVTVKSDWNCDKLLCDRNIRSKEDYREWVRKNHPDKTNNIDEDYGKVQDCYNQGELCE